LRLALERARDRSGWIWRHYKQYAALVIIGILALSGAIFYHQRELTQAATYSWTQTDWSGGADEQAKADHSNNQTNWNKYFSKDDNITAGADLALAETAASTTQSTDIDFNSGSFNQTTVSGAGTEAAIKALQSLKITIKEVAAGYYHTCALTEKGEVYCWGYNYSGQLGDGTTTGRYTPVRVLKGAAATGDNDGTYLTNIKAIAAGRYHTCAISNQNNLYCWGGNGYGQLGDGTTNMRSTPVRVVGQGGSGYLSEPSASYAASGDFVSSAIDLGQNSKLGMLNLTINKPAGTDLKLQMRGADSQENLSAAEWLGPTGTGDYYTASGAINSALNGKRWVQYKAFLTTSDFNASAALEEVIINFTYYPAQGILISSPYNTTDAANVLAKLRWTQTIEEGITAIKFQLRTAANDAGSPGTWSGWEGPEGGESYFNDPQGEQTMPAELLTA